MFKLITQVFCQSQQDNDVSDAALRASESPSSRSSVAYSASSSSHSLYLPQDITYTGLRVVNDPSYHNLPQLHSPYSNDITHTGSRPQYRDVTFTGGDSYSDVTLVGIDAPSERASNSGKEGSSPRCRDVLFTGPTPLLYIPRVHARKSYTDIMGTGAESYRSPSLL
ncbi:hypothetical protein BOTBODRAFT_31443 [Botryobasidium botryosum FD-172 SS1]|uniref:Uncharacterized protein n=1 Tax=Botryobasidium botryosum (strain FD-172 SS1) TaxID=930990 RepID=A0A067MID8_BOTB1|nr:hypothetical protein BOTBODRAFT_31443 [Botryobasidium botryosum FD-172 SS1]